MDRVSSGNKKYVQQCFYVIVYKMRKLKENFLALESEIIPPMSELKVFKQQSQFKQFQVLSRDLRQSKGSVEYRVLA